MVEIGRVAQNIRNLVRFLKDTNKQVYIRFETEEEYNDIYVKENNMYIKINLEITGSLKNRIIADIYFQDDIYDDIILQGKEIYIQRKDLKKLEDGEYYILDLLECNVYKEKELIGKVTDILNNNITETLEVDRKRNNREKIINSNN